MSSDPPKRKDMLPSSSSDTLPNIDNDTVEHMDAIDNSKYTAAVVPETDDPQTPAFTFRAVAMGILFAFLLSFLNTLFSFRYLPIIMPTSLAVLFAYPIGVALSKVLPHGSIWNPGPFSIKEHIIIYVIANAAGGAAYGLDNVVGQHYLLDQPGATIWPSFAFILTTQFIGYGLSGLTRRFLVRPPAMLWPGNLPYVALFRSFHETEAETEKTKSVGGLSRYSMFWIVFLFIFIWTFVPQYFATVLQIVSILCLVSQSNLATWLGSGVYGEGAGVLSVTFDWNVLYTYGPLWTPYYVYVNLAVCFTLWLWVILPIVQVTNPFGTPFLQGDFKYRDNSSFSAINSVSLFDKNGVPFTVSSIVVYPDLVLNETVYAEKAPIYITNMFAIDYMNSFLNIAATISHVALWYGRDIWRQTREAIRQVRQDEGDVHAELMKAYPDVPDWMYLAFAVVMLGAQILVCQFTVYRLDWWATLFGFVLAAAYIVPVGIIQALTGQQIGLNVITEFLIGLMLPGRFVEVVTFKSYAYNIMIQALALTADLKLGHYMHINPVWMVVSQFIGTLIGAVCNTFVGFYVMDNMKDLLQNNPEWDPVNYHIFLNAGALWGAIGPARFFGPDSPYKYTMLCFLIGLVAPAIPWLANKLYPSKYWHYINIPLLTFLNATGYNNSWIIPGFIISTIFNYVIFNRHYAWWAKYNYVISTALDTGMGMSVFVVSILTYFGVSVGTSVLNSALTNDYYCFWNGD